MGNFFMVDSEITDTTADILPHPTGVPGMDRRYIPANINAPAGTVLSQIAPTVGANALKNVSGVPKVALGIDGLMRYARATTGAVDGGRLQEAGAPATVGDFAQAVVMRSSAASDGAAGNGGLLFRKAANGVLCVDKTTVFSDNFSTSWVLMSASWNAATSTYDLYVNGVGKPLGGTVSVAIGGGGVILGAYGAGAVVDVAEIITWPRKFAAADHAAVYAALKAHYPVIP